MTEIGFEAPEAHNDYKGMPRNLTIIIKGKKEVNAIWEVTLDYDDGATYFFGPWSDIEMLQETLINIVQGWDYL